MALQIRRGLSSEMVSSVTPALGEPIYTTDDTRLYIGDGTTTADNLIAINKDINLDELGDVDFGSGQVNNHLLKYDSSANEWYSGYAYLSELADTDIQVTPNQGDVLAYDSSLSKWVAQNPLGASGAIATLTDVSLANLQHNDKLRYDSFSARWTNIQDNLNSLTDVNASLFNDYFLYYNSLTSLWESRSIENFLSLSQLSGVDSLLNPNTNDALVWNGFNWTSSPLTQNSLSALTDVNAVSLANDHVLVYNSSTQVWDTELKTSFTVLNSATDVNITNVQDQDVLYYDAFSQTWQNTQSIGGQVLGLSGLTDVTVTNPQAGQTLIYDNNTGNFTNQAATSSSLVGLSDVAVQNIANDDFLLYNSSTGRFENQPISSYAGVQPRQTSSQLNFGTVAGNGTANGTLAIAYSFLLLSVTVTADCWFTLYTDSTSRTNDASRTIGTDPLAGAGVIAEIVTTGQSGTSTIIMTPTVYGFNYDNPKSTDIYFKVENLSSSSQSVTFQCVYVALES